MDNFDLTTLGGEGSIRVLEYQGKKNLGSRKSFNNVYVKGFPAENTFTEDDLKELFNEFGEIHNTCLMRNDEGVSKGFGFVCFSDP